MLLEGMVERLKALSSGTRMYRSSFTLRIEAVHDGWQEPNRRGLRFDMDFHGFMEMSCLGESRIVSWCSGWLQFKSLITTFDHAPKP